MSRQPQTDDQVEVLALRKATMRGRRASELYHRYDLLGLEDRSLQMDCYFWLIRSGSGVTLLDRGWDRSAGLHAIAPRYRHLEVDEIDPVDRRRGRLQLLRPKAANPRMWVATGHDLLEMDRFERLDDHCADLTKPTFPPPTAGDAP